MIAVITYTNIILFEGKLNVYANINKVEITKSPTTVSLKNQTEIKYLFMKTRVKIYLYLFVLSKNSPTAIIPTIPERMNMNPIFPASFCPSYM